jgi:Asp-tRNA(Asn)/Glu-tRNA(Gln) amidotransferase A subunit family amidase
LRWAILSRRPSTAPCPASSLPLLDDGGLPLGLQLMGFADHDAALFAVAAAVMATLTGT